MPPATSTATDALPPAFASALVTPNEKMVAPISDMIFAKNGTDV